MRHKGNTLFSTSKDGKSSSESCCATAGGGARGPHPNPAPLDSTLGNPGLLTTSSKGCDLPPYLNLGWKGKRGCVPSPNPSCTRPEERPPGETGGCLVGGKYLACQPVPSPCRGRCTCLEKRGEPEIQLSRKRGPMDGNGNTFSLSV